MKKWYYINYLKPVSDFVIAVILIVLFSPILFAIIIFLLVTQKGQIFFFQWRVGKNEECFQLYKFKTMVDSFDADGNLLPDVERITLAGKFIRQTSLDELPQLFNVLKGDMSLVGPRPLLPEYLTRYNTEQKQRHLIKPGITGWAQVNGRNSISWQKKFEKDIWYLNHVSLILDLKILLITFLNVLSRKGINEDRGTTAKPFLGNN
jgi:lipopolysaccharide/colanic/teichoic acid biosynthesis glycosyltransferase